MGRGVQVEPRDEGESTGLGRLTGQMFPSFTYFCARVLRLSLTRAQRVVALVAFDDVDPCDLPSDLREVARAIFGDVERIPASARRTIVLRLGRRSFKSLISAAYGLYRMVTADLRLATLGKPPAVIVIAPRTDLAGTVFTMACQLVKGTPDLRRMLVKRPTAGELLLRRPDGRIVSFRTVARSVGGVTARSYWITCAILDESEFVAPNDVNLKMRDVDIIDAIRPTVLPGSPVLLISTPWPAPSATSQYFDENFGNPKVALCALAPTLMMRFGSAGYEQVAAEVAAMRAEKPQKALREFDCITSDVDESFHEGDTVDRAMVPTILVTRDMVSSGLDTGFVRDACGLIVVERQGSKLRVTYCEQKQPTPAKPLVPSIVLADLAGKAKWYGSRTIAADGHCIETAREHAHQAGMTLERGPTGAQQLEAARVYLRDLFRNSLLEMPENKTLAQQIKSIMATPKSGGGLKFTLPHIGGAHADLYSALVAAVDSDRRKYGSLLITDRAQPMSGIAGYQGLMAKSGRRVPGGGSPRGGALGL